MNRSVFEITIRVVGGLISAYEFLPEESVLAKLKELAELLKQAYTFKGGLPYSFVKFKNGPEFDFTHLSPAEMYLPVELLKLSELTGDEELAKISKKVENYLFKKLMSKDTIKLMQQNYDANEQRFGGLYSVGSGVDSFYEYVYKSWVLTGKKDDTKHKIWQIVKDNIYTHLKTTSEVGLTYLKKIYDDEKTDDYRFDMLECFYPGLLFYT
jgi:hypothetical protein